MRKLRLVIQEGLVPFVVFLYRAVHHFDWSTVNSTEYVPGHLYFSTPDELFSLVVLRHDNSHMARDWDLGVILVGILELETTSTVLEDDIEGTIVGVSDTTVVPIWRCCFKIVVASAKVDLSLMMSRRHVNTSKTMQRTHDATYLSLTRSPEELKDLVDIVPGGGVRKL
jgi:hypothetical protein